MLLAEPAGGCLWELGMLLAACLRMFVVPARMFFGKLSEACGVLVEA